LPYQENELVKGLPEGKKELFPLSEVMKGQPLALVLYVYSTHVPPPIRAVAEEKNIDLVYVPASGTGEYQPLDRKIFRIVKNQLFKRNLHDFDNFNVERYEDLY